MATANDCPIIASIQTYQPCGGKMHLPGKGINNRKTVGSFKKIVNSLLPSFICLKRHPSHNMHVVAFVLLKWSSLCSIACPFNYKLLHLINKTVFDLRQNNLDFSRKWNAQQTQHWHSGSDSSNETLVELFYFKSSSVNYPKIKVSEICLRENLCWSTLLENLLRRRNTSFCCCENRWNISGCLRPERFTTVRDWETCLWKLWLGEGLEMTFYKFLWLKF